MDLAALNAASVDAARGVLTACCGSSRWVKGMIEARPFANSAQLFTTADAIWNSLDRPDWLEAFAHHPRIGESKAAAEQGDRAKQWSAGEQGAVQRATEATRDAQRAVNAQYERKFGYIYIVCATGKSAEEMLAIADARLANDPEREIAVAAEEQRKITRLRLEKLLESSA
jgi:2-oxo-4-hydroxy-4-carboxy-5-ureidoimidazoline decarboxylase